MRGRDVQLLQKDFLACLAELHPASILLATKGDDPRIGWTPEVRKVRLLLLIHPLHPSTCQGFDRSEIEFKSKGIVG